ncbi:MAG: hypothetical protein JWM27_1496 [Gemmatimonadetes bacterium]|nr:hypothetical protein [Gemmatimonadota bacterium]
MATRRTEAKAMTAREVERVFERAAGRRRLVQLTDAAGHTRAVHPYMVYVTAAGRRMLHSYQVEGYSEHGNSSGWKNVRPSSFVEARELDEEFDARRDYNPFRENQFAVVIYAAPTADGRVRRPDSP